MSKLDDKFNDLFHNARDRAFTFLENRGRKVLPSGWVLHLAVGWGITLIADGKMVEEEDISDKKLLQFLEDCDSFEEYFRLANEQIVGS